MRKFPLVILALSLVGCSAPRQLPVARDTTIIHYRDSVRIRDSLVLVNIPRESSSQVTFVTDTSHLETSIAESDAWTDAEGRIHHTLNNKSTKKLPAIVPVRDRVRVRDEKLSVIVTQTVEVEKELTAWQKFRLKAFWWLLGALLIATIFLILKISGKYLLKY